ncbi:MAG: polyphosphate kinase 1 [Solobacterium sp.]|nr:polyphosphate kinase 1 [Solobacterium sp.]
MDQDLYKEGYTQNREISWLHFDDRCLNEAKDKDVPLLERLKFVAIYTSNLSEFFMVRVGSLLDMEKASYVHIDRKSGMSTREQLNAIYPHAKRINKKRDAVYQDIQKKMAKAGVIDTKIEECSKAQLKFLKKHFKNQIAPLLTPQIVDIHHPFPNLQSNAVYIVTNLKYKKKNIFAFVQVPSVLSSIIEIPSETGFAFVHTEDIIQYYVNDIFKDAEILEVMKIRVARSAYIDVEDEAFDEIMDYRKKMLKVLKERKKMNVTMLVCSKKPSQHFRKYLLSHLQITNQALFVSAIPLNMKYAFDLEKLIPEEMKEIMTYPPYEPKLSPALDYKQNIFEQIQEKDVLLRYPYESMEPFLQLLKESAEDPDVVSIRITIYRLASHARLVNYLCQAAENGKEVDVLIELKARFDEQNNIDYSERLEDAGCNVIYGFESYKVHSKICLITKVTKGQASHVTLIATGNFNENTARQYTDLACLTANPRIVKDAISFFKNMSIGKLDGVYRNLLVAPVSLKPKILELIDRETAKKEKGFIFAKINALTDDDIIMKLKDASCAGVKITLLVRGISCLLPGVEGKTENIEVRQIVGRYLEHSRIYIFGTGRNRKMYISSADFMTRNTEKRVEIAMPVLDAGIRKELEEYVRIYLSDNVKTRILGPNGRYHKIKDVETPVIAQNYLMEHTQESTQTIKSPRIRTVTSAFDTKYHGGKK